MSVNVTKHGTIPYVRHGFLLLSYSNFVLKTHPFLRYSSSKMPWPWKQG